MRNLGAAYATAVTGLESRPCYRVQLANHGGGYADPLDVTDHVASLEVLRPLREGNSASIVLHSPTGQYDPGTGTYALATMPANAEVQIDMGEIIAGVPTYWRVFTGEIARAKPVYGAPTGQVQLECLDRARNYWQYRVTSPMYSPLGATPTYWTAHEIIYDLFSRYAGFAFPADFSLDPAGDWTVLGAVQFLDQPLCLAAMQVVQPQGYRVYFDYWGRLASALLVPIGEPWTWAVAGTLLEGQIKAPMDGPEYQQPAATRILVSGGQYWGTMVSIGEDTVMATSRFAHDYYGWFGHDPYWTVRGGGDAYYTGPFAGFGWGSLEYYLQGPTGKHFKDLGSHVGAYRYDAACGPTGAAAFLVLPVVDRDSILPPAAWSDYYNWAADRHCIRVVMQPDWLGILRDFPPYHAVDVEFDIWGHPIENIYPRIYAQDWRDALTTVWGDILGTVEAPVAQKWDQASLVAEQEMAIASISGMPMSVTLNRLDLRPETGDVWTVENPRAADRKFWVKAVRYAAEPKGAATCLEGYAIA